MILKIVVATMWSLWYFGNRELRVHPYRKLAEGHHNDLKTQVERVNLSRAKTVMTALERFALERGLLRGNPSNAISNMTLSEAQNLLSIMYEDFISTLYDDLPGRPRDIIINTLAHRIYEKRKRARREFQGDEIAEDEVSEDR